MRTHFVKVEFTLNIKWMWRNLTWFIGAGNDKRNVCQVDNDKDLVLLSGSTLHVIMATSGEHRFAFNKNVHVPLRTHDCAMASCGKACSILGVFNINVSTNTLNVLPLVFECMKDSKLLTQQNLCEISTSFLWRVML